MSPTRPRRPCVEPRCPWLVDGNGSRCREHQTAYDRERRQRRNFSQTHGSPRHKRERAAFLAQPENRWCFYCARKGIQTPATVLEHAIASKGDVRLHFDKSTWRPACGTCNRKKAAATEGSFGRMLHDDREWWG